MQCYHNNYCHCHSYNSMCIKQQCRLVEGRGEGGEQGWHGGGRVIMEGKRGWRGSERGEVGSEREEVGGCNAAMQVVVHHGSNFFSFLICFGLPINFSLQGISNPPCAKGDLLRVPVTVQTISPSCSRKYQHILAITLGT